MLRCLPTRFNGAVHRSARKVDDAEKAFSLSKAWLQRSRAPECTERTTSNTNPESPTCLLQRSRAPECTERQVVQMTQAVGVVASTEPCTGVHGKRPIRSLRSKTLPQLQRSRAPECTESLATAPWEERESGASTEPCTGVHGKPRGLGFAGADQCQLQRSRAPECTESQLMVGSQSHQSARLQRSRAPECTESPRSPDPSAAIQKWLQRSRAPECTESIFARAAICAGKAASTEPCTGVHGKGLPPRH